MSLALNRTIQKLTVISAMKTHRKKSSKSIRVKSFRATRMRRGRSQECRSMSDAIVDGESDITSNNNLFRPRSSSAREFDRESKSRSKTKKTKRNQTKQDEEFTFGADCGFVYVWKYGEYTFKIPCEVSGEGTRQILFLPSINIASSFTELSALTRFFGGSSFKTFTPDWPGFGHSSRVDCSYSPPMFLQFLRDFVQAVCETKSISVVACGHASGYALQLAKTYPRMWDKIVIISPTYQAPVKVMGWHTVSSSFFKSVIRSTIVGDYLYNKAIQPASLRKQYESHVFKNKSMVTDEFLHEKYKVANKSRGKYAPVSFFTGKLDIVSNREEMIDLLESVQCPVTLIIGEASPKGSLLEMQKMAKVSKMNIIRLDGSLGLAEESPRDVAEVLMHFFEEARFD